jgi:hypothetical protein
VNSNAGNGEGQSNATSLMNRARSNPGYAAASSSANDWATWKIPARLAHCVDSVRLSKCLTKDPGDQLVDRLAPRLGGRMVQVATDNLSDLRRCR